MDNLPNAVTAQNVPQGNSDAQEAAAQGLFTRATSTLEIDPVETFIEESRPVSVSIQRKIIIFLAVLTLLVVVAASLVSAFYLRSNLIRDFTSKGEALAVGLASESRTAIQTNNRETLRPRIEQVAQIIGVSYVLIHEPDGTPIVHTFGPTIPLEVSSLVDRHAAAGLSSINQVETFSYLDPNSNSTINVIDVQAPIAEGQLGAVGIGMDLSFITTQIIRGTLNIALILAGVGIIAILIGAIFAQRLIQPINELVDVSNRVGRGDLSTLAEVETNDEIGFLAFSFNTAIRRLRDLVQTEEERDAERKRREDLQVNIAGFLDVAMDIADGDFTKRGKVTEDVLGNVVDAINLMVEELGILLNDVQGTASSVTYRADEMIDTTQVIVQSANQQASEAQKARAEIQKVTSSIRSMADNSNASSEAAAQTLEASRQGQIAMENTLDGMRDIQEDVLSVSDRMDGLNARSREISEVVDSVTHIASQINLLALSAALEAAGAGEAGARFATVADEVRQLAEESAVAARQITTMIDTMQKDVRSVMQDVQASTHKVEERSQIALEAKVRLQEIASISQQSAELAKSISQATQEQVQGVEEVESVINSMVNISENSQESVLQGREAAEKLQQLAGRLSQNLSRFRLS